MDTWMSVHKALPPRTMLVLVSMENPEAMDQPPGDVVGVALYKESKFYDALWLAKGQMGLEIPLDAIRGWMHLPEAMKEAE